MIRSVSPKMAKYVNKMMDQSERWEPILRQYITKLASGFWEESYVNCAFQLAFGNCDIYAAYCFAHFHAWVSIGKVLAATVELGLEPSEDKAISEMNEKLGSLPKPFTGAFWGGSDTQDGFIKWTEPIELGQIDCTGREIVATVKPKCIPLEVGWTRPDTTIYHILGDGGLARWPYRSKNIYLFVRNPNWPRNSMLIQAD